MGFLLFGFFKDTSSYQFPVSQSFFPGVLTFWHGSLFMMFALQLLCLQVWTWDLFPFVVLLWSHRFRDRCKVEANNALTDVRFHSG